MAEMRTFTGIPVSPGVAIGKVRVLHSEDFFSVPRREVPEDQISDEIVRFEEALTKTRSELLKVRKKIAHELGHEHSDIFSAHLLILEDRTLIEDVLARIKRDKVGAESAFSVVVERYFKAFAHVDDEYLRERIADIRDVGRRILHNLLGKEQEAIDHLTEDLIIISHDLSPSETATMDRKHVIAFATDIGGPTSHTAIMARSMEIPAVVGLDRLSVEIVNGSTVIIDGNRGLAIVHPDKETIAQYTKEEKRFVEIITELDKLRALPAETLDGHRL